MAINERDVIKTLIRSVVYRRGSASHPAFRDRLNELFTELNDAWLLTNDTVSINLSAEEFWRTVREELVSLAEELLNEYERGERDYEDDKDEDDLDYPEASMDDPPPPNF